MKTVIQENSGSGFKIFIRNGILGLLLTVGFFGCSEKSNELPQDLPLATLSQGIEWKETITVKEFESRYTENRKIEDAIKDSVSAYRDFLDRFIDFKLKVKDAKDKKIDKDTTVKAEFENYRKMIAKPYLLEKEVFEKAVKEQYERSRTEIEASHILIRFSEDARPEDTLKAYEKITEVYQKAIKGDSFDSLAAAYSEEPNAAQSKGRLPIYSAGMMVYQFEDKSFETPVGGVSQPFKTRFGYHILKVWSKRPRTPDVRIAHIMIMARQGSSPADTVKAYEKISSIEAALKAGAEFEKLARDSSEDRNSAGREVGGDLGVVSRGTFARFPTFEEAAFSLKNPGDVSAIVRTAVGFHIIKLLERRFLPPFENVEEEIRTALKNNTEKMDAELERVIARWKPELKYFENPKAVEIIASVYEKIDTSKQGIVPDQFRFEEPENQTTAFSFAGKSFSLANVVGRFKRSPEPRKFNRSFVTKEIQDYAREEILEHEVARLENRYPEFKALMQTYNDANLLFANAEKTVYSRSQPNDSLAKIYYDKNSESFRFEDRVSITQLVLSDSSKANALYEELTTGKRTLDLITPTMIEAKKKALSAELKKLKSAKAKKKADKARNDSLRLAKEAELKALKPDLTVRTLEQMIERYGEEIETPNLGTVSLPMNSGAIGLFQKGENPIATEVFDEKPGTIAPVKSIGGGFVIVRVDSKEPSRKKTFEEAKAEASARYQEEMIRNLEDDWVKALRAKTVITIDDAALSKLFGKGSK
ncbi:MAG: peptidylprolyl isomerase [Chloroherpetonaceae bacterium]|nr:peptidylprolyl isomerase [Chloroherpetonaceae bacterium]